MRIKEYITQRLQAFRICEAEILDLTLTMDLDMDAEVTGDNLTKVNIAMISLLETQIFAPRLTNVSEAGISFSWDYSSLGKYYLFLCRKYGITPKEELIPMLGISTITDLTHTW